MQAVVLSAVQTRKVGKQTGRRDPVHRRCLDTSRERSRATLTYCLQHVNKTTTPMPSTAMPPRLMDVIVIAVYKYITQDPCTSSEHRFR